MRFTPSCWSVTFSEQRCRAKYSTKKQFSFASKQVLIVSLGTSILSAYVCNSFYSNSNIRDSFDVSIRRRIYRHGWDRILLFPSRTIVGLSTQNCADIFVDLDETESKLQRDNTPEKGQYSRQKKRHDNDDLWSEPIPAVQQHQQPRLLPPYTIVQLPPWLSRYYSNNKFDINDEQSASGSINWKHYARERTIEETIEKFEFSLVEDYGLSLTDVKDVVDVIYTSTSVAASSMSFRTTSTTEDTTRIGMILGLIDFVNLVLQNLTYDTRSSTTVLKPSREFVIATVVHYVECTSAQLEGATQVIKNALFRRQERMSSQPFPSKLMLPPDSDTFLCNSDCSEPISSSITPIINEIDQSDENDATDSAALDDLRNAQPVIIVSPNQDDTMSMKRGSIPNSSKDFSDSEIWSIVDGAARIKRAEILVQALSEDQKAPSLTTEEAARIRGLLLTIGGDWRALALRCVACLYRLDGILESTASIGLAEYGSIQLLRTPEIVRTAREALRVYSTLAEQLGLHRLKSELEDRAFKVLYRRQYKAVMSLYACADCERNALLQQVATFLEEKVEQILTCDEYLMSQVDCLQITSRVKEPYSFWRKLLKSKGKSRKSKSRSLQSTQASIDFSRTTSKKSDDSEPDNKESLSVTDVHDTIALRVILRGRKWYQEEPDNELRDREESLCYYVQERLMEFWPVSKSDRVKDYIRNPKSNGYMSLHFTAQHKVAKNGCVFPFEIQIRSEKMHEIAEFGVASHWGYKSGDTNGQRYLPTIKTPANASSLTSGLGSLDLEISSTVRSSIENQSIVFESRNSYLHALESARQAMARHQVYVFTATSVRSEIVSDDELVNDKHSRGRLLSVPIRSKVRQVLEAMNIIVLRDWKDRDPYILHNGRVAMMDDLVENGDIIMIQS